MKIHSTNQKGEKIELTDKQKEIGVKLSKILEELKIILNLKLKTSTSPIEKIVEEVLTDFFPIKCEDEKYTLHYISLRLDKSKFNVPSPAILLATAPLYALFQLKYETSNEFIEKEVFLGEFPFFH